MNTCGNCLRWWRHLKRGDGDGYSDMGTCWVDGTRTHGNEHCGYHSSVNPPGVAEEYPPQTEDRKARRGILKRARLMSCNRTWWQ